LAWDAASSQWTPANTLHLSPNAIGPKIITYGDTTTGFGIGVESGETSLFASTKVGFRANASNGTQWAYVDSAGFVQGGKRVWAGKNRTGVAVVSGQWYVIGYHGNWGGGCRFSVTAVANGDFVHAISGSTSAQNIGGAGLGRIGVAANCKDGTPAFNRLGIGWVNNQYALCIRAAKAVTCDISIEMTNRNGDMAMANFEANGGDMYGGVDV
jgi:hypothetical protein